MPSANVARRIVMQREMLITSYPYSAKLKDMKPTVVALASTLAMLCAEVNCDGRV